MLTWINEKAKWVIVIFAAGIVVGLLAMDRVASTLKMNSTRSSVPKCSAPLCVRS